MRRENNSDFQNRRGIANAIFSVLLTVLPVYIFYHLYYVTYRYSTRYAFRGNQLLVLLYVFLLALFLSLYGGYRIRQSRTRELIFSHLMATAITNAIIYASFCLVARHMLPVYDILRITVVQNVADLALYVLARILIPKLEPEIPTLYIRGENDWNDAVVAKFDRRRSSYVIRGTLSGEESWDDIRDTMEPFDAVLLGDTEDALRRRIMGYCFRTGKKVLMIPDMTDIMVGSAQPMVMGDFLLYDLNTQGGDLPYRISKRTLDILASALGLLILSPLMLITALAVKLQDGGPVFYSQTRLTRGGKKFQLAKFRSMIVNAESTTGAVLAEKADSRVTKVGKLIRATRIDELPQLWNILKGDMTLVGPRPERPEFYETICAEYPEFDYRLKVKAGLTGYAQLYGKYNTSFADKARLDMYYIQHASFLLDLQMIFYTLKIIFIRESTEGVDRKNDSEKKKKNAAVR